MHGQINIGRTATARVPPRRWPSCSCRRDTASSSVSLLIPLARGLEPSKGLTLRDSSLLVLPDYCSLAASHRAGRNRQYASQPAAIRQRMVQHRPEPYSSRDPSSRAAFGPMIESPWNLDVFRCAALRPRTSWILVVMTLFARCATAIRERSDTPHAACAGACKLQTTLPHLRDAPDCGGHYPLPAASPSIDCESFSINGVACAAAQHQFDGTLCLRHAASIPKR